MDEDPRKNDKEADFPSSPPPKVEKTTPGTATPALTVQSPSSSTCSVPPVILPTSSPRSQELNRHRQNLLRQIQTLFWFSVASFAALLYLFLPATALVLLSIFVSSLSSLAYLMYHSMILEWDSIVQGRGLGDYLPESVYRQLAQTTLHEWMMDGSFFLEWRHLLLYFVPGISQEQLASYLERLAPQHREILQRPGLGQFFGNDFMRVLMGESRWHPRLLAVSPAQDLSRQLFEVMEEEEEEEGSNADEEDVRQRDDDSFSIDIDLNLDDIDLGVSARGASGLAKFMGLGAKNDRNETPAPEPSPVESVSPAPAADEEGQCDSDREGDVISEAYTAMVVSFTSMAVSTARRAASQAVEGASPYVIGTAMGLVSFSVVIGTMGTMIGVYSPPTRVAPRAPQFPSVRSLWTTAAFGGVSAGMMLIVRTAVRRSIRSSRTESEPEK